MEKSIDRLLRLGQLREEDVEKTEALKMNDLTAEEIAKRRARLRQMRELMFREEAKAKRISKIKSKTYRKIHKKERQKLQAKLNGDEGGDGVMTAEEMLKVEIERAKERATLKVKKNISLAKMLPSREDGEDGEEQRRVDVKKVLEERERLRRQVLGLDPDTSDESSDDDQEVDAIKAAAFEELAQLEKEGLTVDDHDGDGKKSVFQMKFMKDAAARKQKQIAEMTDEFKRELGDIPINSDEDGEDGEGMDDHSTTKLNGRMTFRPGHVREKYFRCIF